MILRHDVDARPNNSLCLARLEHSLGIHGTYYFRMLRKKLDESIIKEIASMGHEIGYHYETMSWVKDIRPQRHRDAETERVDRAYKDFVDNLEEFRNIVPVTTICMHGSPLSRYDNRLIWEKFDYRKLGIIGEASLDVDYTKIAYYTDTGRRWDGANVSIRDKVKSEYKDVKTNPPSPGLKQSNKGDRENMIKFPGYHSTAEMIRAVEDGTFPHQTMLTVHPQRWNDSLCPWVKELIWQNIKNVAKRRIANSNSLNGELHE